MDVQLRIERPEDVAAIHDLTIDAFSNCELGHHGEAELIDRLRTSCPDRLSLVALGGENVVGHVLFTPIEVERDGPRIVGMGLGPMSVATEVQGRGVGSSLVRRGIELLRRRQCPLVVVLGHADYYARFGFVPASELGLRCEFAGIPDGVFRALALSPLDDEQRIRGLVRYRREFSVPFS